MRQPIECTRCTSSFRGDPGNGLGAFDISPLRRETPNIPFNEFPGEDVSRGKFMTSITVIKVIS
jgi:hypothetical protein